MCQEIRKMWNIEKEVLQGSQEVQEPPSLPQGDLCWPAHVVGAIGITQRSMDLQLEVVFCHLSVCANEMVMYALSMPSL
jgi:hypothetical protein